MPFEEKSKKRKQLIYKLRNKYRLVIMNDETLEEKLKFRLSRLNVFVALGTLSILLIFLTTYLIAFTPLKEYIPGFSSTDLQRKIYKLQLRADSLEKDFNNKDLYIQNIKNIVEGKELVEKLPEPGKKGSYENISLKKSKEDSLLRKEIESQDQYNLNPAENTVVEAPNMAISSFNFFTPLKGMVVNGFNPSAKHFGVDIVSRKNEPVKSALDGTVVFAGWTLETGYVIGIQHQNNLMTVYKHNSVLLKEEGRFVKAGEPVAIIGESGELKSGPHLHFELWYNGNPVNPKEYIAF